MKKQIFLSNAEKAAKHWRERLSKLMKENKYSQYQLACELNKRYGTNFTQAMISDWMHAGDEVQKNDGKKHRIGFPVYTNMLLIADFFGVNVGYLTGETDMKTFTVKKVSDYVHLSEEAINAILKITDKKLSRINLGCCSERYRDALNNLLTASEFIELIRAFGDLEDAYAKKEKTRLPLDALEKKLGNELLSAAYDIYSCTEVPEELTEEQITAIKLLDEAIDECDSLSSQNEYDIKVCKYSVQEALSLLINQLYPNE